MPETIKKEKGGNTGEIKRILDLIHNIKYNESMSGINKRKAVGTTKKLWRKISEKEIEGFRFYAKKGYSLRDIGKMFNRGHHIVSYHLLPEEKKELLRDKRRKQRISKKISDAQTINFDPYKKLLRKKLLSCVMQARTRAERKKIPIDIDISYLVELFKKQKGICALTKIPMDINKRKEFRTNPFSPSVDRIDSKKGYTKDNIRLTIWAINWALGEWGEDMYRKISKAYRDNHYESKKNRNFIYRK